MYVESNAAYLLPRCNQQPFKNQEPQRQDLKRSAMAALEETADGFSTTSHSSLLEVRETLNQM